MAYDLWLDRWLPLLNTTASTGPVLEIGCGPGDDTAVLVEAGLDVVAFDLNAAAAATAQSRVPQARVCCQDVRAPFPLGAGMAGAVIASLSLHYFSWDDTTALFARVREALAPGGVLVCRLNSTEDTHFGATGHPMIEPDFFLVDGQPKRFFSAQAIDALFGAGWAVVSKAHATTHKYRQPKALWEVVARRVG